MRALRLMIDGFGSYRERTELDLHDVTFFVLTGPTGSGKSTVIDALCFALYGTVPRWGRGNVIRNALAPSTTECRVCLVFEAGGHRYAAARQLRRDARGNVHTKEARLDRLDASVPPDADLAKLLETGQPAAEGPDQVTAEVTALLGIGYEHFTQCVLLPQGRFAEFLHAKPADRQDLLIRLLAYSVYEDVGQRARERAKVAGLRVVATEQRIAELGEVADGAVDAAQRRVADLAALAPRVDEAVEAMAQLRARWTGANQLAVRARGQLAELTGLHMPDGVAELSRRLDDADALVARRTGELAAAHDAEADAERACAGLAQREELHRWLDGHAKAAAIGDELDERRDADEQAAAREAGLATELAAAERAAAGAEAALRAAEQAHRAAALAADLRPGQPCPVCRQPVDAVPHHDVPADLDTAGSALTAARKAATALRDRHAAAGRDAAAARTALAAVERQLADVRTVLDGAPPRPDVEAALAARDRADATAQAARTAARTARAALDAATRERTALQAAERQAWAALRETRDRFVAMQAPAVDDTDLGTAWRELLRWAGEARSAIAAQADDLTAAEAELRSRGTAAAAQLTALLAEHGVDVAADAARAPVVLAARLAEAERDLADLLKRREQGATLAAELAAAREERQVADLLGALLRSDGFERWLCAEALDSLVLEASATLMQLSGGQYELHRGARNELSVIDHNDAGTQRPVHTLSGGETFQASLALALALSRQVAGLSGGRRDLNSMFLDEGFGTLDEATLDTVASTLERLAEESDCMVGIVTHVPALAERVPVQFAVTRDGASSRLRRIDV